MRHEIAYIPDLDIVRVHAVEVFDFTKEEGTVYKTLTVVNENNCNKVLLDLRNAEVILKLLTAHKRGEVYEKLGFDRTVRIAVLVNKICENLEMYELANTNRGWLVKVSTVYGEAISWLTQ